MHPLSFTLVTSPKKTIKKSDRQNTGPVSKPHRAEKISSAEKPLAQKKLEKKKTPREPEKVPEKLTKPLPKPVPKKTPKPKTVPEKKPETKPARPSKVQKKPEPVMAPVPKKKILKRKAVVEKSKPKVSQKNKAAAVKTVLPSEATLKEETSPSRTVSEQGSVVSNDKAGKVEKQLPPLSRVVDAVPAYARNPVPPYPRIARRRRYEGTVFLEVLVSTTGRAKSLKVSTSSGHQILDQAALKAVQRWVFEPGTVDGKPSEMWVRVPVRFELKGR